MLPEIMQVLGSRWDTQGGIARLHNPGMVAGMMKAVTDTDGAFPGPTETVYQQCVHPRLTLADAQPIKKCAGAVPVRQGLATIRINAGWLEPWRINPMWSFAQASVNAQSSQSLHVVVPLRRAGRVRDCSSP